MTHLVFDGNTGATIASMTMVSPPASDVICSAVVIGLTFLTGAAIASLVWVFIGIRWRRISRDADSSLTPDAHLWKVVEYSFTGALIYVGDQLDLYERLWEAGPISSYELAQRVGWSERWLREVLSQQAAAGLLNYDGTTGEFSLKPEYSKLLRGPENELRSLAGVFQTLPSLLARCKVLPQVVQSGVGVDYDFGEDVCCGIDRRNQNFFQKMLYDEILLNVHVPSTGEGLVNMLDRGVDVADVGCGCGQSTLAMAKRFPRSNFFAFESSPRSLQILRDRIEKDGIPNITVCDVASRTVVDGPRPGKADNYFSFVYSHDVVHDMNQPRDLIREVRQCLSNDGCWVIVDTDCEPTLAGNIARPDGAYMFGTSCLLCLGSATSQVGGEGLGSGGFNRQLAKKWTAENGFKSFREFKIKSLPRNTCYIVA